MTPAQPPQQQSRSVPSAQVREVVERVRTETLSDAAVSQVLALGRVLLGEGRFAEARDLFGTLLEKRPRDGAALYGAALAAFNLGRTQETETLARTAVEVSLAAIPPGEESQTPLARARKLSAADALVLLATAQAVRGDNAAALKSVGEAVALAPEHFDAQFALGRALYGVGDPVGAARAFRSAVRLNPADARALFFLATTLEGAGETRDALAAYRELVRRQPQAAEGHLGLGVLLVKLGGEGVGEGIEELKRAIAINPELFEARLTLGRALVARGRAAEAVEHLRRAADLAPGNPEPHYQLALAYKRLGRKTEADAESAIVRRIHEARRTGRGQSPASTNPDN